MEMTEAARRKVRRAAEIIAPIFAQRAWKWARVEGERVPTVDQIERGLMEHYERLAGDASDDEAWFSASGRLMLMKHHEDGDIEMFLSLGTLYRTEIYDA